MRYFVIFSLLLVIYKGFVACKAQKEDAEYLQAEGSDTVADTANAATTTDSPDLDSSRIAIESLLKSPLDLHTYKTEYGSSNSGGASYEFLHQPDTIGMQYEYKFFPKLLKELPKPLSEKELFEGFRITVFKYGQGIGNFYDTNEELLMISCSLDNVTLGELNWYGKTKETLLASYGEPDYSFTDNWVYQVDNRVISAHFKAEKVNWYRFAILDSTVDVSEAPQFLCKY